MNIDFPPASKGTYSNAGSSRTLANYLEHEDLERIEQGIYTEGFFNLTDDNLYKSHAIKDIDSNIGQLMKTDAKFYAIHVSPSEKELEAMGSSQKEQAEAMKRYIREVFIPEYAKNFNKDLTADDIKFYGKIHFDRDSTRSGNNENKNNMHCHIIVSRKDQSNKKKLSPVTNHRNTKKGAIKGGFDRTNLFQQVEQGFDKLFNHDRHKTESLEYYNTMKNASITDQLNMQEKQTSGERENKLETVSITDNESLHPSKHDSKPSSIHESNISINQLENKPISESTGLSDSGLSSVFNIFPTLLSNNNDEPQITKSKKRKRLKKKMR